jgi:hypothetical protein
MVAFSGLGKIHRDPHQMQVVCKTVGYPDAGALLSAGAIAQRRRTDVLAQVASMQACYYTPV